MPSHLLPRRPVPRQHLARTVVRALTPYTYSRLVYMPEQTEPQLRVGPTTRPVGEIIVDHASEPRAGARNPGSSDYL